MGRYPQEKMRYWAKCIPSDTLSITCPASPYMASNQERRGERGMHLTPWAMARTEIFVIVLRVMYLNREHMSNFSSRFSVKGGHCIGLTNLSPACAGCLEIWEPQPPGNLRTCPGITLPFTFIFVYSL
jgi:hypothetical protein